MDKEILQFIIGVVVIIPILYLIICINNSAGKKKRNFQESRNLESMRDSLSFPNTEDFYRRNPPPG